MCQRDQSRVGFRRIGVFTDIIKGPNAATPNRAIGHEPAAVALMHMGPDVIPALIDAVREKRLPLNQSVLKVIQHFGPRAAAVVPSALSS